MKSYRRKSSSNSKRKSNTRSHSIDRTRNEVEQWESEIEDMECDTCLLKSLGMQYTGIGASFQDPPRSFCALELVQVIVLLRIGGMLLISYSPRQSQQSLPGGFRETMPKNCWFHFRFHQWIYTGRYRIIYALLDQLGWVEYEQKCSACNCTRVISVDEYKVWSQVPRPANAEFVDRF